MTKANVPVENTRLEPKSEVPVAFVYVRRPVNVEVPETVRAVMDEVAKVPWPNESSLVVAPISSLPPIERLLVEVPFVKVILANDEDVFTVRTEMDEVAKVP